MKRISTQSPLTDAGRLLSPRRGATVVECGIVAPVVFLMILGILICGFGIFRYHQIEHLSEESARWLALRGPRYQTRTKTPEPTSSDVLNQVVLPRAMSLDPKKLSCTVSWNADKTLVTVTLSYMWTPEAFWKPVTFRSATITPVIQ